MRKSTLCYIQKDNDVLFLYRNKKKNDPNAGKWIGIGGKCEPGETPDDCVKREVAEETGLKLTEYRFLGVIRFISEMWDDEDMYLYSATGFEGELISDCDEGELKWIGRSEIEGLPMWEGDRYFLKALLDGRDKINMVLRYEGQGDEEHLAEVTDLDGKKWLSRTGILLGESGLTVLENATVAIFGVGGVGGYVAEALARSGVGHFVLTDSDRVDITNINRQIIALRSTVGRYKVDVMKERILDINPDADVEVRRCFFLPENADEFDFTKYSYVVDAVDTVTAKLSIIEKAVAAGVPVISSMGAGNKLDASAFRAADIYDTNVCPLAKVMRHGCKKRGIKKLKVVYSEEKPVESRTGEEDMPVKGSGRPAPGSIAFVPSACGLVIAGEVVNDLTK